MKKKDAAIFTITILLFLIIQFNNIDNLHGNLIAHDTWYHFKISQNLASSGYGQDLITNAAVPVRINYLTMIYYLSVIIYQLTGLTLINFYSYGGAILMIFLSVIIFLIVRRFYGTHQGLIAIILFLAIKILLRRYSMNLPENYSIIFFASAILILIIGFNSYIFSIFLLASIYYHYRSSIIILFMLIVFVVPYVYSNYSRSKIERDDINRFFKKGLKILLVFFVLLLPISSEIFSSYSYLFSEHIGTSLGWATLDSDPDLYIRPSIGDYISNMGSVYLILGVLGLFLCFVKKDKTRLNNKIVISTLIILCSIVIVQQLNGTLFYLPTERLTTYLVLIIIPFVISGIKGVLLRKNLFIILIITLIIIISTIAVYNPVSWPGLSYYDFNTIKYVQENSSLASIKVTYGSSAYKTMFNNSEWSQVAVFNLFNQENEENIMKFISERYGSDNEVYLIVSDSGYKSLKSRNSRFFEIMKTKEVYSTDKTKVYRIDLKTNEN